MLTEERFAKILSILESMGSVTVQQLMTELNASESTIRRDLNALDANGQLTKVHGGAILKTVAYSTKDDNVISRKEKNRDAKNKIAKYAAGFSPCITPLTLLTFLYQTRHTFTKMRATTTESLPVRLHIPPPHSYYH